MHHSFLTDVSSRRMDHDVFSVDDAQATAAAQENETKATPIRSGPS
jgi:hypothetical protein